MPVIAGVEQLLAHAGSHALCSRSTWSAPAAVWRTLHTKESHLPPHPTLPTPPHPTLPRPAQGLAAAVERRGGKIYEGTKAWSVGEICCYIVEHQLGLSCWRSSLVSCGLLHS